MLTWPPSVRVFVATGTTALRRSFDGLAGAAREVFSQDPLSGHVFVFFNRRRDRVKLLLWDRSGYWLLHKKLKAEDSHIVGCTELDRRANNQYIGFAEAGRMVGTSRQSGPRRTIMPRQGSRPVPPRAGQARESYASTNSGRS